MPFRNNSLALLLILVMSVLPVNGSPEIKGQKPSAAFVLPSLQALKLLDYAKTESDKQSDAMNRTDLQEFIDACQSYARGLEVLPKFHEPIPTRGETGISIFATSCNCVSRNRPTCSLLVTCCRRRCSPLTRRL